MWLVRFALRRPISIVVILVGLALCSVLAIRRMRLDIFPDLNLPVIYVAQPYGGMSPAEMEGYITYYYEYHFLYINGIQSVESKSVQGVGLLKLTFHPGTDMSQALAQTISYVNRAHAFMPYGTVPPFVVRFDAGTVPVGYLVFSSKTRDLGQIQDLALNRVRPVFATLPGVSAPPPFGGNQRTIVVTVDPDRLRSYGMSPQEVVSAISSGNIIMPSGTVQTGTLQRIVPVNSVVPKIQDLLDLPLRTGAGPSVYLRDVGRVQDSTDILAGYALFNGRRSVYIPVTKRPDASTLTVVNEVKESLPRFRSLIPEDINISYEFDQSSYVKAALGSVSREAMLGAFLTGVMVLLFLRDWRSSLIVVITIPFALLVAIICLWAAGQTINIMTLGGLALAVGILVDEGTVVVENVHTHLARGKPIARAVVDGSKEVALPRLLAMLCVLAVFVPSFFMTGISRSLFVPLSIAVGFAMAASYFLSSSLVPILSVWFLKGHELHEEKPGWFDRLREGFGRRLEKPLQHPALVTAVYVALTLLLVAILGPLLGRELFPASGSNQFQLRFHAPVGTRVPETERLVLSVLDQVQETAGRGNVENTLGYVGTQGSSYPINTIFLWTSGPQDALMNIGLKPDAGIDAEKFKQKLRAQLRQKFPNCQFSFESGDIVSQIMNFGSPTPVEVAIKGPNLSDDRAFAEKIQTQLSEIKGLRDLQYEQPRDFPSINVDINRELAGQLGITAEQVGRSLVAATSSSRFVTPNYWRDPNSGIGYQVQVQIPQTRINSAEDVETIPVSLQQGSNALIGDVAQVSYGSVVAEYDRENGQRMVTLSANITGEDLGRIAARVQSAIKHAGQAPRGVSVVVRGQIAPMEETLQNLGIGLALAVLVIFLLLAANFQSLRLSLVVIATIPAVILGVIVVLLATKTTLNVQSFMGAIMAVGVAVANAILLVTFAEETRRSGTAAHEAAMAGARARMRPVLMTSSAMIAGMLPMALALGTGAEATAPLGRAVIGGLLAATGATLIFVPSIFTLVQGRAAISSASLDPDDPTSSFRDGSTENQ
ncbi:MAG TPA: efflux RND transporter permease subunit [Candidatus Angelobacter sp.]|nr:efflux RND transporter permease subunit [Candidatus Angelobacter sp.]